MRITILSLDLYGFNKYISEELYRRGFDVTYINSSTYSYTYRSTTERIQNFCTKLFLNKNIKKLKKEEFILNTIKKKELQDYILVIDPGHFSLSLLSQLKPHTKHFIAYNYDSLAQLPVDSEVWNFFDETFSFDPKDCKEFGFTFITNFIYQKKRSLVSTYPLKAFSIQSKSKDRVFTLSKIADTFDAMGISNYLFLVYGEGGKKINKNIKFFNKRIPLESFEKNMQDSEILLDLVRNNQVGLSFRIFEAMAQQKKVITTNDNVKIYDFYNPNNILVIDPNDIKISSDFLNNQYQPIPESIYKKYEISSWVNTLFNLKNQ